MPELDLQEQITRIDRAIAETGKLSEEARKFAAEQRKLIAESAKLDKERWWYPWMQIVTAIAAIIAAVGVIFHR